MGATSTRPASSLPTRRSQALLGPMEGDGHIGPDDRVRGLARGQVDRGRRVDGQHRDRVLARTHGHVDGGADGLTQRAR